MQTKLLNSSICNNYQPLPNWKKKYHSKCELGVSFTPDLTMAVVKLAHIASKVEADCSPLWSLLDIVSDILLPLFYFLVLLNNFVYYLRLYFLVKVVEM